MAIKKKALGITIFLISTALLVAMFVSCLLPNRYNDINNQISNMEDPEVWTTIEDVLVPGAEVSDVRPVDNVLSEKEILIKATKYADERGFLEPDSLFLKSQPKLRNAHIETPIFIHNFLGPAEESYEYGTYLLYAVDNQGECLATFLVDPHENVDLNRLDIAMGVQEEDVLEYSPELARHFITKKEAEELIESQFPGQPYEGPIAIKTEFEGEVWGNTIISWYFTVGELESRAAGGVYDEYLIDASVLNYKTITGGVTNNRSAIDSERTAKNWGGHRMVKLDTPLYFLDKLKGVQTGERSAYTGGVTSPARVSPVPLK